MDVVRRELLQYGVPEGQHLGFLRDIALVAGDARPGGRNLLAGLPGLLHVPDQDVADRQVAALGGQLDGQLSADAGPGSRDHRELVAKILHCGVPFQVS